MNGAFFIGATGLRAQERALSVTANNIANLNTPGFKRSQVRFGELMAPKIDLTTIGSTDLGLAGVAATRTAQVFDQGDLRATGNVLDIAIDGDGFIEVLGSDGQSLLWRGGTLSIRPDGLLATADGMALRALITVPEGATDLRISRNGVVTGISTGDAMMSEFGQIDLVSIRDTSVLESVSGGLYRSPEDKVSPQVPGDEGAGMIMQGSLESSNVALSTEMVELLLMQRAYAASAQALQAGDQLMSIANGLRR